MGFVVVLFVWECWLFKVLGSAIRSCVCVSAKCHTRRCPASHWTAAFVPRPWHASLLLAFCHSQVVCCFRCCMRWAKREFFTFNQQACSVPVRRCRHRIVPELETPVLLSHTMVSRFADYQFCGFGFCGDWANAWDFPSMKRTPVRRSGFISVHTHSPSMKPFTQVCTHRLWASPPRPEEEEDRLFAYLYVL